MLCPGFAAATGSAEIVEQTARPTDALSRDRAEIAQYEVEANRA